MILLLLLDREYLGIKKINIRTITEIRKSPNVKKTKGLSTLVLISYLVCSIVIKIHVRSKVN